MIVYQPTPVEQAYAVYIAQTVFGTTIPDFQVPGRLAVPFLSQSGVDRNILRDAWNLVDPEHAGELTDIVQLYVVLRIVALAQYGPLQANLHAQQLQPTQTASATEIMATTLQQTVPLQLNLPVFGTTPIPPPVMLQTIYAQFCCASNNNNVHVPPQPQPQQQPPQPQQSTPPIITITPSPPAVAVAPAAVAPGLVPPAAPFVDTITGITTTRTSNTTNAAVDPDDDDEFGDFGVVPLTAPQPLVSVSDAFGDIVEDLDKPLPSLVVPEPPPPPPVEEVETSPADREQDANNNNNNMDDDDDFGGFQSINTTATNNSNNQAAVATSTIIPAVQDNSDFGDFHTSSAAADAASSTYPTPGATTTMPVLQDDSDFGNFHSSSAEAAPSSVSLTGGGANLTMPQSTSVVGGVMEPIDRSTPSVPADDSTGVGSIMIDPVSGGGGGSSSDQQQIIQPEEDEFGDFEDQPLPGADAGSLPVPFRTIAGENVPTISIDDAFGDLVVPDAPLPSSSWEEPVTTTGSNGGDGVSPEDDFGDFVAPLASDGDEPETRGAIESDVDKSSIPRAFEATGREGDTDEFGDFEQPLSSDGPSVPVPEALTNSDAENNLFGGFNHQQQTTATTDYSIAGGSDDGALSIDDAFEGLGAGVENAPLPSLESLAVVEPEENEFGDFEGQDDSLKTDAEGATTTISSSSNSHQIPRALEAAGHEDDTDEFGDFEQPLSSDGPSGPVPTSSNSGDTDNLFGGFSQQATASSIAGGSDDGAITIDDAFKGLGAGVENAPLPSLESHAVVEPDENEFGNFENHGDASECADSGMANLGEPPATGSIVESVEDGCCHVTSNASGPDDFKALSAQPSDSLIGVQPEQTKPKLVINTATMSTDAPPSIDVTKSAGHLSADGNSQSKSEDSQNVAESDVGSAFRQSSRISSMSSFGASENNDDPFSAFESLAPAAPALPPLSAFGRSADEYDDPTAVDESIKCNPGEAIDLSNGYGNFVDGKGSHEGVVNATDLSDNFGDFVGEKEGEVSEIVPLPEADPSDGFGDFVDEKGSNEVRANGTALSDGFGNFVGEKEITESEVAPVPETDPSDGFGDFVDNTGSHEAGANGADLSNGFGDLLGSEKKGAGFEVVPAPEADPSDGFGDFVDKKRSTEALANGTGPSDSFGDFVDNKGSNEVLANGTDLSDGFGNFVGSEKGGAGSEVAPVPEADPSDGFGDFVDENGSNEVRTNGTDLSDGFGNFVGSEKGGAGSEVAPVPEAVPSDGSGDFVDEKGSNETLSNGIDLPDGFGDFVGKGGSSEAGNATAKALSSGFGNFAKDTLGNSAGEKVEHTNSLSGNLVGNLNREFDRPSSGTTCQEANSEFGDFEAFNSQPADEKVPDPSPELEDDFGDFGDFDSAPVHDAVPVQGFDSAGGPSVQESDGRAMNGFSHAVAGESGTLSDDISAGKMGDEIASKSKALPDLLRFSRTRQSESEEIDFARIFNANIGAESPLGGDGAVRSKRCVYLLACLGTKQSHLAAHWSRAINVVRNEIEAALVILEEALTFPSRERSIFTVALESFVSGVGELVRVVRLVVATVGDLLMLDESVVFTVDTFLSSWKSIAVLQNALDVEQLWKEVVSASLALGLAVPEIESVTRIRATATVTATKLHDDITHCQFTLQPLSVECRDTKATVFWEQQPFMACSANFLSNKCSFFSVGKDHDS